MATQSGFADGFRSSTCFQLLLGFFFNKGVRGGPRVLLNLAAVLMALIIIVKLLPTHMTQTALQSIPLPQSVWSSIIDGNDNSVPGGLRIVVFGEIDIGTPVAPDDEMEESKTWTEALCDQVMNISAALAVRLLTTRIARLRPPHLYGALSGRGVMVSQLQ